MSGETVLVTGGAGYIGAHTCFVLAEAGFRVVVYDSLVKGHRAFVRWGPFEHGDVRDRARLDEVFRQHSPAAVVHFAALIEAGVSVRDPGPFYDVNTGGVLALLDVCRRHGAPPIVFSSTCATYGAPQGECLDESHPQWPLNPYGWSKLAAERAFADHGAAHGQRSTMLRYFNASGAAPEAGLGERHDPETHAVPLAILAALGRRPQFTIFGDDYPTPDGTAVRDYIHVLDLAAAHVAALKALLGGAEGSAYNLGAGVGTSVRQLTDAVSALTGRPLPLAMAPRRPGDAAALIANPARAKAELGWVAGRTLEDIVQSALRWHRDVEPRLFGA